MKALYRISDASNPTKIKFPYATKENCLDNFLTHFSPEETILFANNLSENTKALLNKRNLPNIIFCEATGDASSFRVLLNYALDLPKDEIIYFVEDDYLHRNGAKKILHEGLEKVDYVSLYDHVDKYLPPLMGGNPLITEEGFDNTSVFLTDSTHWKLANSTTFCFATKVGTITADQEIFWRYTMGPNCVDYPAFRELIEKGRKLATPIPGYSTHCEIKWASPLINWREIVSL